MILKIVERPLSRGCSFGFGQHFGFGQPPGCLPLPAWTAHSIIGYSWWVEDMNGKSIIQEDDIKTIWQPRYTHETLKMYDEIFDQLLTSYPVQLPNSTQTESVHAPEDNNEPGADNSLWTQVAKMFWGN